MANLLIVYVAQASQNNLKHGLDNGIWGFKENVAKELLKSKIELVENSYILIGFGYSGGSPRVKNDIWKNNSLSEVYLARISSNFFIDNTPEWEDERSMEKNERYSVRINFDTSTLKRKQNIELKILPELIAEDLRLSAIAQSRGYLLEGIGIKHLLNVFDLQDDHSISSQKFDPMTTKKITPKELIDHVYDYIIASGFQFSKEEVANFYLSLRAKPFVILAGISGTGKTQLPRKFGEALGFDLEEQIRQVPVRPDWTDSSELLGYTSLDGKFIPKDLTTAIQAASANPDRPYFFILDEMNLARVEHYFSDYLSIIETRRRGTQNEIVTDKIIRAEMLVGATGSEAFQNLRLPENLYMIGTVNMDETTHSFSKKVLDRANSIEMNEVNLRWIETNTNKPERLKNIQNELFVTPHIDTSRLSKNDKDSIHHEMKVLIGVNNILQQADLHFAYRVRDEIAFYLLINKEFDLLKNEIALDFQLVQKVLPRIHGSSDRIQRVLVELIHLLEKGEGGSNRVDVEFSEIEKQFPQGNLKYKRTSRKILFMLKRFEDDRFTSFWL